MVKNLFITIANLVLAVFILVCPSYAKGLEVSPPSYLWRVEALGVKVEMPIPVKIINHSGRRRAFTLQAKTPTEINTKVDKGFEEIPDTAWVAFETAEVEVLPEDMKKVKVYMNIPKENENFGQWWMLYIEVKEKPPRGDRFALACYPKIYLATPLWRKR